MGKAAEDSEWQKKKKRVVEMLAEKEMSTGEIARVLEVPTARVCSLMYQIPDSALLYEYEKGHETWYGRLKREQEIK